MNKILVLGQNGMLGNAVYQYFNDKHAIETIEDSRWNSDKYRERIMNSDAEFIINCVGAIPQKKLPYEYYELLNVELPMFLETTNKKIIHPSTDCEFSGMLSYPQKYNKNNHRDAYDDYGKSKAKISKKIECDFKNTKTIRTSVIGHEINNNSSLLDWFLSVNENETVNGYNNYHWNGITTLMWAKIAEKMITDWNAFDTIIQIGTDGLSKYNLLKIVKSVYGKSTNINGVEMAVPLNKILITDIEMPTIEEQLIDLKNFYKK